MNRHVPYGHCAAPSQMPPPMEKRERLDEIERVLKFDPCHPYRRQMVREYLDLTEPCNDNERAA